MHVVVFDEELPYPPNSGKRIRTLNLIRRVAARHRVTYVCHRNADRDEAHSAEEYFRSIGVEPIMADRAAPAGSATRPTVAFYARLVGNLASPYPYSVQVHTSRPLRRALSRILASGRIDLIHCEWTPYARSVPRACGVPHVIMAHNVESLIWQRYHQTEPGRLKRWYIRQQWAKFERFEREAFARAARVITVSREDAALARSRFGTDRLAVVENGVDTAHFQPLGGARSSRKVLFLGSLDWRPNLDAVRLLLGRIFPDVKREQPQAELVIVGRKPPKWVAEQVRTCSGASLHADVPDVRPFLRSAAVMVVPLRIGGGSRLKILEAAAAGLPVVSTRVGAEGLRLKPGEHFVQAESVEHTAAALVDCLRNRQPTAVMARRARQMVVQHYDWNALADKLERVWRSCAVPARPAKVG